MGNRDNRFRVLAVFLSILFFCIGIVLTLGIFLPIAGLAQSHYALFAVGQRVFSVYGFSSFLIPLLFLYGAVLLLIPGWSRESKAVLLGVPLYCHHRRTAHLRLCPLRFYSDYQAVCNRFDTNLRVAAYLF